jgi:hypothetical protein
MELFPRLGDGISLAIIFNYVRLAYDTTLLLRPPEGGGLESLVELWSGQKISDFDAGEQAVSIPLKVGPECELLAIEARWA